MGLALAFLAATAPIAVALALGLLGVSPSIAWLAGAVVGGALGWVWYRRDRHDTRWMVSLGASVLAPLLVLGFVVDAVHVVAGSYPTTTLRQLVAKNDVIAVTDGVVKPGLEGLDLSKDRPHHDGTLARDYVAAPLVEPGWTRTDPVASWVRCEGDRDACEAVFHDRPLVGEVQQVKSHGLDAIAHAISKHDLRAPARVLVLDSTPKECSTRGRPSPPTRWASWYCSSSPCDLSQRSRRSVPLAPAAASRVIAWRSCSVSTSTLSSMHVGLPRLLRLFDAHSLDERRRDGHHSTPRNRPFADS